MLHSSECIPIVKVMCMELTELFHIRNCIWNFYTDAIEVPLDCCSIIL